MLAVDVGDDGDDGGEFEEAAVALVALDDEQIALADAGVGPAHGADAASDDDGGIEAAVRQNRGGHRCGCGFAVATADGDAVLQAHQLGEQFATRDDGNLAAARLHDLGIRFVDGGSDDEGGDFRRDVRGGVTD